MRIFPNIDIKVFAFAAIAFMPGCDPESEASEDEAVRGKIGKADLVGSCEGACGGPSSGNCWCDDACEDFGDCCQDKVDVCEEPGGCPGENPAGCAADGCGDGQTCQTDLAICVPSACGCDEQTGSWLCTADCGGGTCVDDEPVPPCEGDNPAGCVTQGCEQGEVCSTETDACVSSACGCDEATGTWLCTADCGGGECVPAGDTCSGTNPAELCSDDPNACIPSGCACNEALGVWECTPDCSGGQDCANE
jgi:hypothetical protein